MCERGGTKRLCLGDAPGQVLQINCTPLRHPVHLMSQLWRLFVPQDYVHSLLLRLSESLSRCFLMQTMHLAQPASAQMCCAVNATSPCLVCINHFSPCGIVHFCHLDPLAPLFASLFLLFWSLFYGNFHFLKSNTPYSSTIQRPSSHPLLCQPYATCCAMRLPGVPLGAFVVRLPRSRPLHHLKVPTLFAPRVVDLHGCFTLRRQVQVLLRQVCPQLPDLKLETVDVLGCE